jgi:PucR family transcriptional regulator, purine catabolism regulatory protein
VHLRGLLTLLADDLRLTAFADRELAALRDQPELLRTLRAVVEHAGRKSAAASSLNISRQVLYDRIAKIERLLGSSLDDAELRTSLHVALLADDVRRSS